jgi:Mg2+-importing ATPase
MIEGLSFRNVKKLQQQFGPNTLRDDIKKDAAFFAFLSRFKNPLVIILLLAATLSFFFGDKTSFFIIVIIVALSVGLDFLNTYRSQQAAEALKDKVRVKAQVIREGGVHLVAVSELVPGDVVMLSAGKVIPADGVVIDGKDLSTNEAALTGESFPQGKPIGTEVYMGSGVISGSGVMRITKTGQSTKFSHIAQALQSVHRVTEFEKEIKDFSVLIIKITFFLVLFVLLVNIMFHRNLLDSILFSLALAVGLTPELLPLIITLNLSKGSLKMAKEGVIVKQLSAVQNFGSMDILCTDKTGTLTENKIKLVKYVDGMNKDSAESLRLGYLVSALSTSFSNPLDSAVKAHEGVDISMYLKIDEIPFDFERKRQAVIVHHTHNKQRFLVVEGAPEEVLKISNSYGPNMEHLGAELRATIQNSYDELSRKGFRVLAVAQKEIGTEKRYEPTDENNLTFYGFLAFLDPAKLSILETLKRMSVMGITTKIITGDNAYVTEKIANDIGLKIEGILDNEEMDKMSQEEFKLAVEKNNIFARVNPEQKMKIIQALQQNGHIVGYMGDGINDAPSLRAADVGISVNNAVDVAKDAADFILLRKSLHELVNGVTEGRKTFANTMKYLRMALSSNFGNMFSMAGASLFLPFLPMLATQILLNNLLYDSSQFAIPLDAVDESEVITPHTLSIREIKRFMWSYGLLSSIFDFVTFGTLLLIFHTDQSVFQAGWFLESILTQVFVVYIIRTKLIPFKQSWPSPALIASTLLVVLVSFVVVISPIRFIFQFGGLSVIQILSLVMVVAVYLLFAQLIKKKFYGSGSQSRLVKSS